jgi:hypothetical protein
MKKIMMTLAAVLFCATTMAMMIACTSDNDAGAQIFERITPADLR